MPLLGHDRCRILLENSVLDSKFFSTGVTIALKYVEMHRVLKRQEENKRLCSHVRE